MDIYRRLNDMKIKSSTSIALAVRPRPILHGISVISLFALAVGMMAGQYHNDPTIRSIKYATIATFSPIVSLFSTPAQTLEDIGTDLSAMRALYDENQRLQQEHATLVQWKHVASRLEAENKELRSLLGLGASAGIHTLTAHIISDSHDHLNHTMLIRADNASQLRVGLPVMSAEGVVGHTIEVDGALAKILLITDRLSRIPVQEETTGTRAILMGTNEEGSLLLQHTPNKEAFPVGTHIVTVASDVFPIRMPIGVVTEHREDGIIVAPYAHTSRLRFVTVAVPDSPTH
ncbi:MAG: rod shape-determining protein MreC [Alphaproteobacteria bacterium]|nr:MAG: rod shape-determining protein MreC [Alphaproteobacteria bacterium]TAF13593.1 MAG: rod shape-determining protein MreC [Alphaproteobacteria bacterium]TAF39173.1 MAG: rod shape-determining protein MreC [Alphaproteobacteria bacterium]TAF74966.1 MAG: rod shape-determining protein MreC [Alphaproteobacteria bacterium]